ncbi:hypothetical protein L1049_026640 [Liquidambar formosana]|uniref:Uncharacterized protein n=1 Tax=Liquidambar formosana TaxID=63359 RepID=A0AAP0R916_LIQFO
MDTVLQLDSKVEQCRKKGVKKEVRFESQFNEFSVLAIVETFLRLYYWVGHIYGLDIKSKLFSSLCDEGSKFIDRKLLSELIEDLNSPSCTGFATGKLAH